MDEPALHARPGVNLNFYLAIRNSTAPTGKPSRTVLRRTVIVIPLPNASKGLQNPQVWLAHIDARHQLMFVIDRGTLLIQPIEPTGTTKAALQTLM